MTMIWVTPVRLTYVCILYICSRVSFYKISCAVKHQHKMLVFLCCCCVVHYNVLVDNMCKCVSINIVVCTGNSSCFVSLGWYGIQHSLGLQESPKDLYLGPTSILCTLITFQTLLSPQLNFADDAIMYNVYFRALYYTVLYYRAFYYRSLYHSYLL